MKMFMDTLLNIAIDCNVCTLSSLLDKKEKIVSIKPPNLINPGKFLQLSVDYSIKRRCDLIVMLEDVDNRNNCIAYSLLTLEGDKNRKDVHLFIDSNVNTKNNYRLVFLLVLENCFFDGELDRHIIENVRIEDLNDMRILERNSMNKLFDIVQAGRYSPGKKYPISIKYSASDVSDVIVTLEDVNNNYTWAAFEFSTVNAGVETLDIELDVKPDAVLHGNYRLIVKLVTTTGLVENELDRLIVNDISVEDDLFPIKKS